MDIPVIVVSDKNNFHRKETGEIVNVLFTTPTEWVYQNFLTDDDDNDKTVMIFAGNLLNIDKDDPLVHYEMERLLETRNVQEWSYIEKKILEARGRKEASLNFYPEELKSHFLKLQKSEREQKMKIIKFHTKVKTFSYDRIEYLSRFQDSHLVDDDGLEINYPITLVFRDPFGKSHRHSVTLNCITRKELVQEISKGLKEVLSKSESQWEYEDFGVDSLERLNKTTWMVKLLF